MNLEIDFYIPSKKVGIEVNGMYWHSTKVDPDPYKHQEKSLIAMQQNIKLFQLWEYQIKDPHYWTLCKSMINHSLGKSIRLFARKCYIKEIDNETYKFFVMKNHLHGYVNAKVKIGLFHKDVGLVSLVSFSAPRFDRNYEWEIIRYATKQGYTVVGGFSKILKYFLRNYKPKSIITYADLLCGYGNVYRQSGFKFVKIIDPGYFYFKEPNIIITRYQAQKQNLHKILNNYDPTLTEEENMSNNKFLKIYDAGDIKWELVL